jgi:phage baseplate assembly protein W
MSAYNDAQRNNESDRNAQQYKDLDLFFGRKTNNDLSKITDVEAVKRSVRNLILHNTFEKPFHPEIGGNVRGLLFENMTPMTSNVIARKIQDTIENFEPRARLVSVQALPDIQENGYKVSVYFYVVNAPTELVQLDSFLERLR